MSLRSEGSKLNSSAFKLTDCRQIESVARNGTSDQDLWGTIAHGPELASDNVDDDSCLRINAQWSRSEELNPTKVQDLASSAGATGVSQWSGEDRTTGIQSVWEIGPPQAVPASHHHKPYNTKFIRNAGASTLREGASNTNFNPTLRGFKGYSQSREPEKDFVRYRVVEILFVPHPMSAYSALSGGQASDSKDEIVTRMRRFVIIGPGARQSFEALPIKTYNGKGVGAPGVVKSHHAIIHSSKQPPKSMEAEHPSRTENGMRPRTIRVKVYDRATALDPKSRLDFFDLHEFDYNHPFKFFGTVHHDSRPHLIPMFSAVRAELQLSTYQTAPPQPRSASLQTGTSTLVADSSNNQQTAWASRVKKVTDSLQMFRQIARSRGIVEPSITQDELRHYAKDAHAFRRWQINVKSLFADEVLIEESDSDEDKSDEDYDDDDARRMQ